MKMNNEMKSGQESRLVAAPVLARKFGVSAPTVRLWATRGVIPVAVRVGRVLRFDLEAVSRALASVTRAACPCVERAGV
jgi:predicted site-specific integrase-resolvase